MVKRSRLEISFDVLKAIEGGIDKPTHIMYSAHVSWNTFHEIIKNLIINRFIEEEKVENSRRYSITGKGRRALSYHRRALEGFAV